jgi:hypothetical protein
MKQHSFNQHWRATQHSPEHPKSATDAQATPWVAAGMIFLIVYVVQATTGWHWSWLASLQEIELYKQITGLALTLLFLMQWRLTAARMEGDIQNARRRLITHRNWGAIAPLLLLLHASEFGYAYIRVLCLAFLALISLGLLHQSVTRLNQPWVITGWMVLHVALATMLICLIGYHGFNSFYYE